MECCGCGEISGLRKEEMFPGPYSDNGTIDEIYHGSDGNIRVETREASTVHGAHTEAVGHHYPLNNGAEISHSPPYIPNPPTYMGGNMLGRHNRDEEEDRLLKTLLDDDSDYFRTDYKEGEDR
jgi:hypothetical protein